VASSLWLIGIVSYLLYFQHQQIKAYQKSVSFAKQRTAVLNSQSIQEPLPPSPTKSAIPLYNQDLKQKELEAIITKYTRQVNGEISIYYKDLGTDKSIIVNGDKRYYMASLYKVILVLYLLDKMETGLISLDDRVGTSSATLSFAINKIITESNNEYAQILANQYGWENIEAAMKERLGIEFSFGEDLSTTVVSIGHLFEEIAYSLRISERSSSYLLKLLNNQKKTNKLPKYLPQYIYSHNKTGEYEQYSHDAGIFYTPKANYILVVMTKSTTPALMDEQMAQMSKEIFDTLNKTYPR
jgi:beta-lactamase class A